MIRRIATWAVVSLLLALGGAGQSSPPAKKAAPRPPMKAEVPPDPIVVDSAGYAELLAKHRGKPVMVSFWATWCEPCRDEYPMVNELAQKYAAQGLVVLAVSLDEDGEMLLVRRFLARTKPVFPNYRKKPGQEEPFINSVDPKWSGAIPATFFYGRDGQKVASLVGEHKREEFEKAIQELLARPASR